MSGSHPKVLLELASDAPEYHRFLPVPQISLTIPTRNDARLTIKALIALREAAIRGGLDGVESTHWSAVLARQAQTGQTAQVVAGIGTAMQTLVAERN